ncbi:MAG TPA: hypothetical protein VGK50_01770 [Coriobacteriia bacterium]
MPGSWGDANVAVRGEIPDSLERTLHPAPLTALHADIQQYPDDLAIAMYRSAGSSGYSVSQPGGGAE